MNEQNHAQQLLDAIADLQAARIAQGTMIEAMLISHPSPSSLRKAWDALLAPRMAHASLGGLAQRQKRPVDAYVVQSLQDWTAKLDRSFPRTGSAPD